MEAKRMADYTAGMRGYLVEQEAHSVREMGDRFLDGVRIVKCSKRQYGGGAGSKLDFKAFAAQTFRDNPGYSPFGGEFRSVQYFRDDRKDTASITFYYE